MVKQNSIDRIHAITGAIVLYHPIGVKFSGGVGTLRMEWRLLGLWRHGRAKKFARRSLVKARALAKPANCLEHARGAQSGHIRGVLGHIKRNPHMALSRQMIDFIRFGIVNHIPKAACRAHVAVMQKQPRAAVDDMGVLIQVVNAFRVESARPADDAVDFITLRQQHFCQVRPILPGDAGNDCFLHVLPLIVIEQLVYRSYLNTI